MGAKAETAIKYIDQKKDVITSVSDQIWALAEVGLHENESAAVLAKALEAEGFQVTLGVADMPSALVATWGSGKPVIGFLGEYDALPGVSQKAIPRREELVPGGAGHGCGHNLLGAGAFGAVIGLKQEMMARNLPGTIKYFGCPAEENFGGKAFMARAGLFDDCDVCLTWHPGTLNQVRGSTSLAVTSMNITFHGRTAHASGDPYNGRSALDAIMLTGMGVEFLREHMSPKARIHYVITNGGSQPNVVPAKATAWFYVRAPQQEEVEALYQRVLNCAYGAAQMTETKCEVELLDAIYNVIPNTVLENVLDEAMQRVGPPVFGEEELKFAEELVKTFEPGTKEAFFKDAQVPEEVKSQLINNTLVPRPDTPDEPKGSTDVGDVSWCCPTAQFTTACNALGTPGHSWQYTAQAGMGIGHAGMIAAAKVMAEAGFEILTSPDIIAKAKEEFLARTGGKKYKCAMPPDHKPAFHQLGK
ncbi:MAG TPA: amidohydrolase [Firmicutes bacterium]|nr:amidohydrolase [Candidatus Fermentithermobacillaceae bacterium]